MRKYVILAGLVTVISFTTLSVSTLAANKHIRQENVRTRRAPGDAALGPKLNYPRYEKPFSSSSERYYTGGQVNSIPFRSPAEALEIVPGLAVGR